MLWSLVATTVAMSLDVVRQSVAKILTSDATPVACLKPTGQYVGGVLGVFLWFGRIIIDPRSYPVLLPTAAINAVFDGATFATVYAAVIAASRARLLRASLLIVSATFAAVGLAWLCAATLHWRAHTFGVSFREAFLEAGLMALWQSGYQQTLFMCRDWSALDAVGATYRILRDAVLEWLASGQDCVSRSRRFR